MTSLIRLLPVCYGRYLFDLVCTGLIWLELVITVPGCVNQCENVGLVVFESKRGFAIETIWFRFNVNSKQAGNEGMFSCIVCSYVNSIAHFFSHVFVYFI